MLERRFTAQWWEMIRRRWCFLRAQGAARGHGMWGEGCGSARCSSKALSNQTGNKHWVEGTLPLGQCGVRNVSSTSPKALGTWESGLAWMVQGEFKACVGSLGTGAASACCLACGSHSKLCTVLMEQSKFHQLQRLQTGPGEGLLQPPDKPSHSISTSCHAKPKVQFKIPSFKCTEQHSVVTTGFL